MLLRHRHQEPPRLVSAVCLDWDELYHNLFGSPRCETRRDGEMFRWRRNPLRAGKHAWRFGGAGHSASGSLFFVSDLPLSLSAQDIPACLTCRTDAKFIEREESSDPLTTG